MQFPREPNAATGVAEDVYDLRMRSPVVAPRPVGERNLVPLIVPRPRAHTEPAATEEGEVRTGGDRRRVCRRIFDQATVLDTRSGTDRRGTGRRRGEAIFNVDVRV